MKTTYYCPRGCRWRDVPLGSTLSVKCDICGTAMTRTEWDPKDVAEAEERQREELEAGLEPIIFEDGWTGDSGPFKDFDEGVELDAMAELEREIKGGKAPV